MSLVGTIQSVSQTITYTLTLVDPCILSAVTTQTPGDQTYTIGSGSSSFSFTAWTAPTVCGSFTYTASQTAPSAATIPTSWLSFNSATRQFTINTSTLSDAGTYTIQVQGTVGGLSKTITYQITLTDPCTVGGITTSTPGNQAYTIGDPAQTFSFTDWTVDYSVCGTYSYVVT